MNAEGCECEEKRRKEKKRNYKRKDEKKRKGARDEKVIRIHMSKGTIKIFIARVITTN